MRDTTGRVVELAGPGIPAERRLHDALASARFFRDASGGWPVVLIRRMTNFARFAVLFGGSFGGGDFVVGQPSSSSRVSTTMEEAFLSLSTFCSNVVSSVAISSFIAFSFALSLSDSVAPARTKSL